MIKQKEEGIDNVNERLLLTGLIVSDRVANEILPILDTKTLSTPYSIKIADWCREYWEKHKAAPKKHIKNIFDAHKSLNPNDGHLEVIEQLLMNLSKHFSEADLATFNEKYVSEEAEKYVKECAVKSLCSNLLGLAERGRVVEAEAYLAQYRIPKRTISDAFDVLSEEFWNCSEEDDRQVLFRFNGALGTIFGDFERDSFISILGKEKIGKTNMLLHITLEAVRNRCNTLFIGIGDMTVPQIRNRMRRMMTGVNPKYNDTKIKIPIIDCLHNQKGTCPLNEPTDSIFKKEDGRLSKTSFEDYPEHTVCIKCKDKSGHNFVPTYWHQVAELSKYQHDLNMVLNNIRKKAMGARFELLTFPGESINIAGIKSHLSILQDTKGFIPDVIVIDYADVLAGEPGSGNGEDRHRTNRNWVAMRALSQEKNCCVVTATQGNKESGQIAQISVNNLSEDKRKAAHVTALYALNQTAQEKRDGIMRVSCILKREEDFDYAKNCVLLQNLNIGRVNLNSYIERNFEQHNERGL